MSSSAPTPQSDIPDPPDAEEAEFGPGGYLPQRAAQRARKIVLREQMGLHWPIAAVVAGLLIVAVTLPFVLGRSGPPGPPFVDAGPLAQVDPRGDARVLVDGVEVLVVRGGGVLAAFADAPEGARYCPTSRRIESPDGSVWSLQGVRVSAEGPTLSRAGVLAVDDRLYLDIASAEDAGTSAGTPVAPACERAPGG